jgi:hypothetical protein
MERIPMQHEEKTELINKQTLLKNNIFMFIHLPPYLYFEAFY